MNVLMVGVCSKRLGGMWTVAEQYLLNPIFNEKVNLTYISTATSGSLFTKIIYMIWGLLKVFYTINKEPIDIIHVHMAEKGSYFRKGLVVKWGKKRNKKIVIHIHSGSFVKWYLSLNKRRQASIKKTITNADCVLVLGEFWRQEFIRLFPHAKIKVLYNGIRCFLNNPYNATSRNIIYLGALTRRKGVFDLLDAIALINKKIPKDVKVIMCGHNPEPGFYQSIIKNGLKDRVEIRGWVFGTEKEKVYRDAMICVLPSYCEGMSMTVLEAMAMGVPVVTTNVSTMPELLDGTCMVEAGDIDGLASKILSLVFDDHGRESISKKENVRVSTLFGIDSFIENTLNIYTSLISPCSA